jgi:hypothetical protein
MCHKRILVYIPCYLSHILCHVSIQGNLTYVMHSTIILYFQVGIPVSLKYFLVLQVSFYPHRASIEGPH